MAQQTKFLIRYGPPFLMSLASLKSFAGLSLKAVTGSTCYGWVYLIFSWCYWWNCLLLIEFTHKVTCLLQVWWTKLEVTENLMTPQFCIFLVTIMRISLPSSGMTWDLILEFSNGTKWIIIISLIYFRWDHQFVRLVWIVWWSYTGEESWQRETLNSQIYQKIRSE